MDIPVIIDGIDVSGCKHYKIGTCVADYLFTNMNFSEAKCKLSPDCYYKQLQRAKEENEEQCKIIQCKTGTILSLAKIRDELKAENEKLKQKLKQQQYKRELNYGQGYKAYATEKGVFAE